MVNPSSKHQAIKNQPAARLPRRHASKHTITVNTGSDDEHDVADER